MQGDLIILCHPGERGGIKGRLDRWLRSHGLTLNEKKTRVLESRERRIRVSGFFLPLAAIADGNGVGAHGPESCGRAGASEPHP